MGKNSEYFGAIGPSDSLFGTKSIVDKFKCSIIDMTFKITIKKPKNPPKTLN